MDNTTDPSVEQTSEVSQPAPAAKPVPRRRAVTLTGFVLGLIAWALMMLAPVVSGCVAAVGCVLSAIGCAQPRSGMRNLAITGVIVSAVLLVIYGLFVTGINLIESM